MSEFTTKHKILASYADRGAINYVVRWNVKVCEIFLLTICVWHLHLRCDHWQGCDEINKKFRVAMRKNRIRINFIVSQKRKMVQIFIQERNIQQQVITEYNGYMNTPSYYLQRGLHGYLTDDFHLKTFWIGLHGYLDPRHGKHLTTEWLSPRRSHLAK